MKNFYLFILLITCFLSLINESSASGDYQIGVYYFPGWKDNQIGAEFPKPWEKIKPFPQREPLIGYYKDGDLKVTQTQIDQMSSHGIDFVVYDWYWSKNNTTFLDHAINAYMKAPNRQKLKFSILWANHFGLPSDTTNFETMVYFWIKNYFKNPQFMHIDGKPVVFVFSADALKADAERFGSTTKELLAKANEMAIASGLKGIYFVGGTPATQPMIDRYAPRSGYNALSAYNYHSGLNGFLPSHSYRELDQGYRAHWQRFSEKSSLPLIVPMTSGWDKRPWGGSKDPFHDDSLSTPEEFKEHLMAAKALMDNSPVTNKMGVICCWNEFGEGSFIEPTKSSGLSYLEIIKKTFTNE